MPKRGNVWRTAETEPGPVELLGKDLIPYKGLDNPLQIQGALHIVVRNDRSIALRNSS